MSDKKTEQIDPLCYRVVVRFNSDANKRTAIYKNVRFVDDSNMFLKLTLNNNKFAWLPIRDIEIVEVEGNSY